MLSEVKQLDKQYYMNTFGERTNVCFERGEGVKLYDCSGKEYYDFLGGIAVNALGHHHPILTKALHEQIDKVLHTSNLYYIEKQARLAEKIVKASCADKVFFSNTGAEANEGAFKLAKIYFYKQGIDKYEIISLDHSFHGRTLATVAATGQEKYQKPYRPLTPGFKQVKPNDFEALEAAVTDKTAAIMIELIQGESGVHPMDKEYVQKIRKLCDEKNIVLIFDEVQTGMGRTGELFAYMNYGVEPDIFTLAKALGCGVPIGAVCAKDKIASAFEPGDHGTTFGGNPLAVAAGCAVFEAYESENILDNVKKMSAYITEKLNALSEKHKGKIVDIRAAGLLIGIEFAPENGKKVFSGLFDRGFLTSLCGGVTIRIAPPLIITEDDAEAFVNALDNTLETI